MHEQRQLELGRQAIGRGLLSQAQAEYCLELTRSRRIDFLTAAVGAGLMSQEHAQALGALTPSPLTPSMTSSAPGLTSTRSRSLPRPGETLGGYVVEGELGRGGMGAVFLARQGSVRFAIKIITSASGQAAARFEREAEALAAVDRHPNVVRVHAFAEHQGMPYLVLDFVEGGSLEDMIEGGRVLDPKRAAEICLKVAQALAFIHKRGILHRDLKPDNILIRAEDGEPLLTDFGLAKAADSEALTRSHEVLGTPFYMSPEQVSGDNEAVDGRSELWSLGVVLYQLCTGQFPFGGSSTLELVGAISGADPIPPRRHNPSLSRDLESIILTCLEKEQEHRYASCGALATDLERYLSGQPVESRHSSIATVIRRRVVRRIGLPAVASIVLGLVALGGLGWLGSRWAKERRWRTEASAAGGALMETLGDARRSLYEHLAFHFAEAKNAPPPPACALLQRAEEELARIIALRERAGADALARDAVREIVSKGSLARLRDSVGLLRVIEAPRASRERGEALPKAERALARGLRALAFHRYAEAHTAFQEAAKSSGLAPAARLGQGLAALGMGNVEEVAVVLERLPERLAPLYRGPRIQVHAARAVGHILEAKNASLAAAELEALSTLGAKSKGAWKVLNARLAAGFRRLGMTGPLIRSWDFATQLKRDHPAPWRLPSSAKLHQALADRARKAGDVRVALHHIYKLRELRPEAPIPLDFRAQHLFNFTYQKQGLGSRSPKAILGITIEASRAGILAPVEADEVLAPLHADGTLDELVRSAPRDPVPRFWRGLCEHYRELRRTKPEESKRLLQGRIEDLSFCLADPSLSPSHRAKALEARARHRFYQDLKCDPVPLLRDLDEALSLPHPRPDRVLFLIYRLNRFRCTPEQRIRMLERSYKAAVDRLQRSGQDRLAEGRPELAPLFPMGVGCYRRIAGGSLTFKAIELVLIGRRKEALKAAEGAYEVKNGSMSALEIYGYCLTLAGRKDALKKLRRKHLKDMSEAKRRLVELYWKNGPKPARGQRKIPPESR